MTKVDLEASTVPYLQSHSGLEAMKDLQDHGYNLCELIIFPSHCLLCELTLANQRNYANLLDGEGTHVT